MAADTSRQNQPDGRAAAAADRRADAARRARGELLVPAPPGRLRVDRRAGRAACGSSTWPAARATAPTCSPRARGERRRRRRQPGGPRARPAALRARPTCASSATWSRASPSPATRSSSCRRSSTSRTPARSSSTSSRCWRPAASPTSRRPTCSPWRPPGAEKSDNPWHVQRVPGRRSSASSARRTSPRVELLGLFHARKLRAHELAIRLGWDRVHRRLGLTKPFYDRFTPGDRRAPTSRLAAGDLDRGAGLPRRLPWPEPAAPESPATWRSSSTPTCPTSRASGPTRSARSGCSTR